MLKVGDEVRMKDGSWAFGIEHGEFAELLYCRDKGLFTVIKTGLRTLGNISDHTSGSFDATADILITDGHGGYWFVPSRFAVLVPPLHKIVIDNKTIEISDESYQALKKQLIG